MSATKPGLKEQSSESDLPGLRPSWVTVIGPFISHCLNFLNRKMRMIKKNQKQLYTEPSFPHGVITVRTELTHTKHSGQFLAYAISE